MNQQTCNPAWLDAFLKNDLNQSEEQMLTSHLDECSDCREELESRAAEQSVWREASNLLGGGILLSTAAISDIRSGAVRSPQIELVLQQLAPTDDPESLGRIGGYEVTGVVGAGGMGVVLKAHDRSLDRIVAIKVMSPHLASSGSARRRFAREAKAAAAVLHPNVIAIHSVASEEANPFLVMPYVRGASLQKRIDSQGPLPLKDTLRIGAQIAAGLAAAHEQGLVHRDIKPANILLEEGVERVTITDFGLARAVDDASMTCSGVIAGTPQYMSPEQTRGEPIDARSDLFSLGSVLYAMCAGRSPFRAETTYGVLHRIANDNPTPVCEVNTDVPVWLGQIIERLMAKRPGDRFESAAQVAELLEGCLAHVQQPAAIPLPEAVAALAPKKTRRPPIGKFIAAAVGAFALMFAGILIVLEVGKGTLTIESELDDVPIRIMQGEDVVKSLTVSKEGAMTRIGAGKYIVEIGQEFDKAVIKDGGVELSRGATAIVKVTQTNTNTAADEKAKDEAAKAWLRRPVVGSTHDGKSFQLAGHDALMHSVMTNNSEALNRLLTMDKYDLDFSPSNGSWTLLQTALQHSCLETTSLLLRHGANPNFASKGTPLPLELAKRSGRIELVALLQEYLESVPPVIQTVQLDENAKDLLLRLKGVWKLDATSFGGRKLGETRSNVTLRLTDRSLAKFDGPRPLGPVYEITNMNAQTDPVQISLTRELKGKTGTLESLLSVENGVLTLATPIYPQNARPQSLEPAKGVKVERWKRFNENTSSEKVPDTIDDSSTVHNDSTVSDPPAMQSSTLKKEVNLQPEFPLIAWDFEYPLLGRRMAKLRVSKDLDLESVSPGRQTVKGKAPEAEVKELIELIAQFASDDDGLPYQKTVSRIAEFEQLDTSVRTERVAVNRAGRILELQLNKSLQLDIENRLWRLEGIVAIGGQDALTDLMAIANRQLQTQFPEITYKLTTRDFLFGILADSGTRIVYVRIPVNKSESTNSMEMNFTLTVPSIGEPQFEQVVDKNSAAADLIETPAMPKTLDKSAQERVSQKIYTAEQLIANGMDLLKKQQPVTVRFKVASVRRNGVIDPDGKKTEHWFLSSEEYKGGLDPKAFQVQVSKDAEKAFERRGIKDIPAHFNGKELTIVGKISTSGLRLPGRDTIWFYSVMLDSMDQLDMLVGAAESVTGLAEKLRVAKGESDDRKTGQSYKIKLLVLASDDLKPVAGAMVDVTLIRTDSGFSGDGGFSDFKTDADGVATIDNSLWPGRYQILVRAPEGSRFRDTEFSKDESILVVHEDGRYSPREFRLAVDENKSPK
jgi:serine/threonine protein kinase